jgi:hypothetical protein
MTYHGDIFIKEYNKFKKFKKLQRINSDCVISYLKELKNFELTFKEYYILKLKLEGKTFKEIAEVMHEKNIFKKPYTRQRIEQFEKEIIEKIKNFKSKYEI